MKIAHKKQPQRQGFKNSIRFARLSPKNATEKKREKKLRSSVI